MVLKWIIFGLGCAMLGAFIGVFLMVCCVVAKDDEKEKEEAELVGDHE